MADAPANGAGAAPPIRRSALAGAFEAGLRGARHWRGPGVRLAERHPLAIAQVEARRDGDGGEDGAAAARDAVAAALGVRPPEAPNTAAGGEAGRPRVLWTGPGRWLAVEPAARDLAALLEAAAGPAGAAVVDMSHGRSRLRLSGRDARRVLAKGAPLDWHPSAFAPGACAQTALFHLPVLIDCRDADAFDLYAARGYALDLCESLIDAAAEYGCEIA